MAKLNEYLMVGEAADFLGVSKDTLRRWDRAAKLKARRHPITGYRLYVKSELNVFLGRIGGADKTAGAEAKRGRNLSKARSRRRKG